MENLLRKILEKKRSERSSSDESSTSPDAKKKPKSGNFPEGVEEHEVKFDCNSTSYWSGAKKSRAHPG